jgi:hypothetical protein
MGGAGGMEGVGEGATGAQGQLGAVSCADDKLGGVRGDGGGSLDLLLAASDRWSGYSERQRRSQRQLLELSRGLRQLVSTLLQPTLHPTTTADGFSHGALPGHGCSVMMPEFVGEFAHEGHGAADAMPGDGAAGRGEEGWWGEVGPGGWGRGDDCRGRRETSDVSVPAAQVDAHLTMLARVVASLHRSAIDTKKDNRLQQLRRTHQQANQALMRELANLFPPSHPSGAPGGSGQQRGVDAVEAIEQVESAFAVSRALQVSSVHLN